MPEDLLFFAALRAAICGVAGRKTGCQQYADFVIRVSGVLTVSIGAPRMRML